MTRAVICAPLRVEKAALRTASTPVIRTGMGPRPPVVAGGILVAGVGGGLDPAVRPGDVVVASEVRAPDGRSIPCPSAPLLADALRELGLTVHIGPIESAPSVVNGTARRVLAKGGALAAECESAWLAPPPGTPFAVVRSIVDTQDRPLWSPGIVPRGIAGLRALRRAVPALDAWAKALRARELVPAEYDLRFDEVDLGALAGAGRIGVPAGTPAHLVDELARRLAGLGPVTVTASDSAREVA